MAAARCANKLSEAAGRTDALGWLGLYSDVSKVGNLILFGRQIDGHDEISG